MVSIVLILVSIEINRGITFIDGFSSTYYEINAISVIVLNNSDYEKLNELEGKSLGINQNEDQENLTNALTDIREQLNSDTEYKDYNDWNSLADSLYNSDCDAIVVNEAYRSMLEENHQDFDTETKVIYQFEIKTETENIANDGAINDGVFDICITGIDT